MRPGARWSLLLVGVSFVAVACGANPPPKVSTAAPPLVVCGTTVINSPAGAAVYDIGRHHHVTQPVTNMTVGNAIYVRVSDSCAHGAKVTIRPATAFSITRTVRAADGRDVLVVLRPNAEPVATLTASRSGVVMGTLSIDITGQAP